MAPVPTHPKGTLPDAAAADARLAAFREQLTAAGLDAFIIPSADPHNSEFAPAAFARRAYLSGFTGSAGTAVVTAAGAWVWTDGRYFLQATRELPPSWALMRIGHPDTPSIAAHVAAVLPAGGVVGIDPLVYSIEGARELAEAVGAKDKAAASASGGGRSGAAGGVVRRRPAAACATWPSTPWMWCGRPTARRCRRGRRGCTRCNMRARGWRRSSAACGRPWRRRAPTAAATAAGAAPATAADFAHRETRT
eukprot:TRINITY_DN1180_c0_g1_i19.p2 TRINITY_DN1180_c0_g1~~TRINITY_DN1180_c0_g1_i19.p2  ORF type:complete len:291 (+),score=90.23 TRINITY_DN1180_c0_g1_i19:123-875(+)